MDLFTNPAHLTSYAGKRLGVHQRGQTHKRQAAGRQQDGVSDPDGNGMGDMDQDTEVDVSTPPVLTAVDNGLN